MRRTLTGKGSELPADLPMPGAAAIVNGYFGEEKMMTRPFLIALAILAVAGGPAAAQTYPQKNVQYIIPFVPGGESDVMARWQ
jgi:hypothetical protein